MVPSNVTYKKQQLLTPWVVKKADRKSFAYTPTATLVPGKDGNLKYRQLYWRSHFKTESYLVKKKVQYRMGVVCLSNLVKLYQRRRLVMDSKFLGWQRTKLGWPYKTSLKVVKNPLYPYQSHKKFPLQLKKVVIPFTSHISISTKRYSFLSKNRLTHIKNSIYYNNSDDYVSVVEFTNTCKLGLGSNHAMYLIQQSTMAMSSIIKATQQRKKAFIEEDGQATSCNLKTMVNGGWGGYKRCLGRQEANGSFSNLSSTSTTVCP